MNLWSADIRDIWCLYKCTKFVQYKNAKIVTKLEMKVDGECYERMELLMEQTKAEAGITEELKISDQMKWVGLMIYVRCSAEENVLI